ncbi:MAG: efflux RND transporter periplasmic adaptor subunit [Acidiferrobacterales bacterium]
MQIYTFIYRLLMSVGMAVLATQAVAVELPELDCLVEPHMVVEVSSPVGGVIQTIHVDRSDVVQEGQTLAELESAVEQASVELARARATMDAEVKSSATNFAFNKRKYKRIKQLYGKKAVPFHQKDEARTDLKLAQLKVRQAKRNKKVAELELKRAEEILKRRTVKSPIAGVVVARWKSPGEFVEEEPIVKLAQIDPLRVEVVAPASLFGSIKPGLRAEIKPEVQQDDSYIGTVSVVDRIVDAASGTFGVRLELPNPDHRLPGGLKCRVRFLVDVASP